MLTAPTISRLHHASPASRTSLRRRSKIRVADLFAGAGGASTGLLLAAADAGLELDLVAINHWPAAVATHAANHPHARHLCEAIERVDPRDAVPGGHLDLLLAGPECTFFSNARGGLPIDDQRRSSAWSILRWLELLRVDHVLIENVVEFQAWAPLDSRRRPIKSRRGQVYRAFLAALEAMNYYVDTRVLVAADYGEATTRRRLFIQAARGRRRIVWPEPTHSRTGDRSLLRDTEPWRPARDIIDWSLPSRSIFNRPRPLSRNTLRRIQTGLDRFGAQRFVLGQQSGGSPRRLDQPLPTITADGAIAVIEPFVVEYHGDTQQTPRVRDLHGPLPTQTTENRFGLVQPFLIPPRHMNAGGVDSLDRPLRTITAVAGHAFGLVQPLIATATEPLRPGRRPQHLHEPLGTIPPDSCDALVESRTRQLHDLPATTPDIEPFTLPYCSNGGELARPVSQPVSTITTRDRLALVMPRGMDIHYRLLQPRELAAAMGFPPDYQFIGTKGDTIRMIGNAWSCRIAKALCAAILERHLARDAPSRRPTGAPDTRPTAHLTTSIASRPL